MCTPALSGTRQRSVDRSLGKHFVPSHNRTLVRHSRVRVIDEESSSQFHKSVSASRGKARSRSVPLNSSSSSFEL